MSTSRYDFSNYENYQIRNTAKLLYVSFSKSGSDWHSIPHTHHCSELFFILKGSGQFIIENGVYPICANDLIIINPLVSHTERAYSQTPFEYIVLGVEGLELSVKPENPNDFCIINFQEKRDILVNYLKNMIYELEHQTPGYEIVCQNLTEIVIIILTRLTNFETTLTPIPKNASRLCAMVRRFIDYHYKENISLDMLADTVHINKYYLVHTFTEEYGISPMNYLSSCRIREAKHLLETTDISLSSISTALGFSSPSYFSQSFRRRENMSPVEYRKRYQNKKESGKP